MIATTVAETLLRASATAAVANVALAEPETDIFVRGGDKKSYSITHPKRATMSISE